MQLAHTKPDYAQQHDSENKQVYKTYLRFTLILSCNIQKPKSKYHFETKRYYTSLKLLHLLFFLIKSFPNFCYHNH